MNSKFWKQKNVLITGLEGFLGSNLTKALIRSQAKIYGIDIKTKRKDTILTQADYGKIAVIKGSVTDIKLIQTIIKKNRINIVFHLAAESLVENCLYNPLKAFSANIEGTWKVLEACRGAESIEAIVIASSDKAYGSHKKLPYRENTSLIGDHPYDVSKSCADLLAYAYFHTYNLPVAITRSGNIYGPGDFNFSRLIPDAMRCLALNRKLLIRSDGKFVRDYVHVNDIVNGYIRIAELFKLRGLAGEAFNLSDEKPLTVLSLLGKIKNLKIKGFQLKYEIVNRVKYEIKKQYLSSRKARQILDWKPCYNLESGLNNTAEWYINYFSKK